MQIANDILKDIHHRSWGWLQANSKNFSVTPYVQSPRLLELLKPFSELVLASALLSSSKDAQLAAWAMGNLSIAWSEFEQGRIISQILEARPDLMVLVSVYAELKANGYVSLDLDKEIGHLASTPGYMNLDLPAWRRLGLLHGLHKLGLASENQMHSIFQMTWLAGKYSPWTITDASAYGVTHSIFYMNDYGAIRRLPPDVTDYLRESLPMWFNMYVSEQNYDLAAEILMSMYCIGEQHPSAESLTMLSRGQSKDGSLIGPEWGSVGLLFGETDEKRVSFLQNYHTTLVNFIASAMFLGKLAQIPHFPTAQRST